MRGEFAVLFGIMSLFGDGTQGDGWNVQRADASNRMVISSGTVIFDKKNWGKELRLTRTFTKWKRFNPVLDFSITDKGGAWLGLGLYQQFDFKVGGVPAFAGFSFAPGAYMQGGDVNLGFPIEFRSGLEFGVRFDQGWQLSLSYDHRSNGDISAVNPGMETFQVRFSKAFN